jgi:hypothetical protein
MACLFAIAHFLFGCASWPGGKAVHILTHYRNKMEGNFFGTIIKGNIYFKACCVPGTAVLVTGDQPGRVGLPVTVVRPNLI